MITIRNGQTIKIEWTILKYNSEVKEDLDKAKLLVFLVGGGNKRNMPYTLEDRVIHFTIPTDLPIGVYRLESLWLKGDVLTTSVDGVGCCMCDGTTKFRTASRSIKSDLFAVSDVDEEVSYPDSNVLEMKITTSAVSYGYDGLSAYELAVLHGEWNKDELAWLRLFFTNAEEFKEYLENYYYKKTEVDTKISRLSDHIGGEIESIDDALDTIHGNINNVENEIESVNQRINDINLNDIGSIKTAVTNLTKNLKDNYYDKEYLEDEVITEIGRLNDAIVSANEKVDKKQDTLVSGKNIKTINNQSILGEGNITIEGGGGSVTPKITDTLNVTSVDSIKQAQAKLTSTYDVAFFLITDSAGMLPSKNQEAVSVSVDCIRQLSLSSPNSAVQAIIGGISIDGVKPRGMNVGDIIALARVPVSIDALASYVGLSSATVTALKMLGVDTIEVYQYKIWVTTSTKGENFLNPDASVVAEGVEGLMSIYDKHILNANNLSTKYGYGTNFDDCLTTGVCAYSPANIGGVTENFTLVVQRSSTVDSGGFYTIIQSAYGRTGEVYNRIFQRMIFHNPSNGTIERHDWVEISTSAYVDKAIYSVLNTEV